VASKDRAAVESGLSDLLGNVIKKDREQAGRGEAPKPGESPDQINTSVTVLDNTDNKTSTQTHNNTDTQYDNNTETQVIKPPRKKRPAEERPTLERRFEEAKALAETSTTTMTLRIPAGLNAWLDEYVHGSWPDKVKKQQLVTEALMLLYARRGKPKEEILPTELLEEKS
jgi:hypothetical protein